VVVVVDGETYVVGDQVGVERDGGRGTGTGGGDDLGARVDDVPCRCSMVPSTTPMARATRPVRSVAVRMSGGVK
jgi:hypothetical protein